MKTKTRKDLLAEIEELRTRLEVTEETLRTLQSGDTITPKETTHLKGANETLSHLASFPELNPNPVMEIDVAGNVYYLNPAAKQLFPDLQTTDPYHPWLRDLKSLAEIFECQRESSIIRELKINNSWYEQAIYYVSENNRIRIYGLDITERKQTEQALEVARAEAENEKRRLEAVMDALPVGVAITDTQGGNIRSNKAFEQIWGSPRPSAVSISDYAAYKAWWSETGKPVAPVEWASAQAVQKGEAIVGQLLEIQRFDGSHAFVINSGAPIFDVDGKIAGCAVAIQDITDLRKAEEALHQERDRLAALVNSICDEVWFADAAGQFTLVNPSGSREFNLDADATIDARQLAASLEVLRPDGTPRPIEESPPLRALSGEVVTNREELVRTPATGELRYRQVSAAPVRDISGNIIGSVSVVRDITERKLAEEALRKSKERFELLSETASRLLSINRPQEILNELCQKVMTYLDCHAFFNYLADEEKDRLHLNAYGGIPEEVGREIEWLDYGVAVCGCAARDASQIVCENIPTTPDPRTELVKSFGIKAYACHPLFSAGRVIGTLSFGTRSRLTFTEDEISFMKTVADQVAIAMERIQLIERIRRSRDELEIRVQERTAELANAYKELKEQSRILESFFKYTVTPLVFLDRDFNFIRVNEAYAKACKREVSEFPGHNHFEFYPSDAKAKFEQVVKTKEPYVAIARSFTFPDHPEWGETYWDWTLTPILDDAGEVEYLVFSLRDVTKRKRAEDAMKAEKQRFNDVLEILPAYLILLAPDYHVSFANRFFRQRFGESQGRRCFDYLFGRSEPCETCETYRVLKTMSPHEWEWTGPDGRNYDVFDFPFTDVDGSTLILEMGIDITERKQAEEKLKTTSLYARSLIEASLDPLVTISRDGKIMDVNSATELITGVPRNQLIGSDFLDYFTEPEKAREGYQQVFRTGSVRDYPLSIRHTSGHITDVLYNATLYKNEVREVQGVFAAARDITERKRAEDALKESENRLRTLSSQLLTVQENERKRVARELHDGIGQLLTAIKFKVENIFQEKGEGKPGAKEKSIEDIIPMIKESIEEVRRIQMDLRPSILDDLGILATLEWFCREYQKIYSHIYIEKKINLQENDMSLPLKTAIYRVTQEAMNNIAKHSQADSVHLSLRKQGNTIELTIKDNGTGFDLEEILSPERSKRGLGLNSMRERTELSGGSFFIESTAGKGTTIKASWPL